MPSPSDLLANVIPTKWSQVTAALTLLAIPSAYNAPSLLPPTWLPNSPEQVFLIRLLLSALTGWAGSLLTLLLILHYYIRGKGRYEIAEPILKEQADKNRQALVQGAYIKRINNP